MTWELFSITGTITRYLYKYLCNTVLYVHTVLFYECIQVN
jgi:hypothetical protein